MRLFDTYTRSLFELPPPPGPIRMYFCGPTVYQRIHIGNARPFVLSMWLKRWLEESGYDVRLAENITDINDKIYLAAPGRIVVGAGIDHRLHAIDLFGGAAGQRARLRQARHISDDLRIEALTKRVHALG